MTLSGRVSRAAAATFGERGGLRSNSAMSMAALIVLGGTRVVYGSLISRATGPETYGAVAVLIAVTMVLSLLLPAGLAAAISRFVPYARGAGDAVAARAMYRRLNRLSIAAAVILSGIAAAGALYIELPGAQVAELTLLTGAYALYLTFKAALYAFDRVGSYLGAEIASSATTLLATLAVLAIGSGLYLSPLILGYAVFAIYAMMRLRPDASSALVPSVPKPPLREPVAYTVLACVGSLASAGFLYATQLLAANLSSLTAAAYFAASITLISPLYFLPRSLGLALFPFMAEAHGARDLEAVRRHADLATRALFVLVAPIVIAGQLLAEPILVLYGGAPFADGTITMQVMLIAAYLAVVQVASVNALSSASGEQLRITVGWAVAGAATGLVVIALTVDLVGAIGIAIGYLAGTAVTAAGPIAVVWRTYSMRWRGTLVRALGAVLLAFVAARYVDLPYGDGQTLPFATPVALLAVLTISIWLLRGDIGRVLMPANRPAPMATDSLPSERVPRPSERVGPE